MAFPDSIPDIQPFLELHTSSWTRVYKAYQASLARYVLLKVLDPVLSRDPENAAWFTAEAQLTARIRHPNVVAIFSYGESRHGLYYTAEFVDGISLREILDRGHIPVELAVYVVEHIALGLQAVHKQEVLHRDLKPENVLIAYDGQVKLTDFGFASVHGDSPEDDTIKGTIGYLAPELLFEQPPSPASDLFALGVVLFELLAARKPFQDENMSVYLDDVQQYDPVPVLKANPFNPPALIELCKKLLMKNQADRCQHVDDVLQALKEIRKEAGWEIEAAAFSDWVEAPDAYVPPEPPEPPEPSEPPAHKPAVHEPPVESASPPEPGSKAIRWGAWASVLVVLCALGVWILLHRSVAISTLDSRGEMPVSESDDSGTDGSGDADGIMVDTTGALAQLPAQTKRVDATDMPLSLTTVEEAPQRDESTPPVDSLQIAEEISPEKGRLTVLCTPSCDVEMDGEFLGHAPPAFTLSLAGGRYALAFLNENLPAYEMDVSIQAGQHDTLRVPLLATVGTLELAISPWGHVYIDTTYYGVFPPVKPLLLAPGQYTIRVNHPVLGEHKEQISIGAGEKRSQTITLTYSRP